MDGIGGGEDGARHPLRYGSIPARKRYGPSPTDYVLAAWGTLVIFGGLMTFFWLTSDDRWRRGSLLLVGVWDGGLGLLVIVATEFAARRTRRSRRHLTREALEELPSMLSMGLF